MYAGGQQRDFAAAAADLVLASDQWAQRALQHLEVADAAGVLGADMGRPPPSLLLSGIARRCCGSQNDCQMGYELRA